MTSDDPVAFYTAHPDPLRQAWAEISAADQLAPVAKHLPTAQSRVLDVGAGIGTVAAWLALQGHEVTAAEPVKAFHDIRGPLWVEARLPDLQGIAGPFDLILTLGVWQHLAPQNRVQAMGQLSALMAPRASLIMALRHGKTPDDRPSWDSPSDDVVHLAERCGFSITACDRANALQKGNRDSGVSFTWLVLRKTG